MRRDQIRAAVSWSLSLLTCVVLVAVFGTGIALAQPPGTVPSKQIFDQGSDEETDDVLPIHAFWLLSVSGNPVMVPGLTWEEYERLLDREAGRDADRQSFSYQELEIRGSTQQSRAEMEVVLRMNIEPTEGRWVAIPLRMGNFHQLAPPDVSGVDEYFMALAPDDSGYLLFVKADSRQEAMLRMRVAARVETNSVARSLAFRLPDVPARVMLTTDEDKVSGEVVGRGDEAIQPERVAGGTKFSVNSGGGTFALRWGKLERSTDDLPLLEVESRVNVRWDTPQDQPIASVQLRIKNVHGSVDALQLRLPSGSVVLEPPRLGTSGRTIELGAVTKDGEFEFREVTIPKEERQQRIELNFDLQLANDNASAASSLDFRVPEVVGALRHRGDIEIQTGGDYRLRWEAQPWISGELGESRDDGTTGRFYRFRFDRASFELPALPLWLNEKERQLRMSSKSEITVLESIARLQMTIQVNGQTSDGRLRLDDASWRLSSIEDVETGESLDSFKADSYRIIEFNSAGSEEPAPIRVHAELQLDPGQTEIRFPVPRVVEIDETALVQSATVDIINSGRTMLVVDLEASTGLSRIVPSVADTVTDLYVTRFQLLTDDTPAEVVGVMIDQPPRIDLGGEANIELDGDQLRTTVDWIVLSFLDLEGRLPIRIPKLAPIDLVETQVDGDEISPDLNLTPFETRVDLFDGGQTGSSDWVVTVDDMPAKLRQLENDHYELISDRLAMGSMKIRWRHVRDLRRESTDGSIESVSIPRPDLADVTFRGVIPITLRGNQQFDLTSSDSPPLTQLDLDTLPRDPLRLKLRSLTTRREELSIRQTILRTAVGRYTRHEQVLASIQGGESFRVGLPASVGEISVEAFIDGELEPVRRDRNTLIVPLPGDKLSHVVDLSVWVSTATASSWGTVEPTLKLPIGAGRVYWQIVAPTDGHVVWASPTLGRSMAWRFDRWKLHREASHGDQALTAMAGSKRNLMPPQGNRYLYVGSDLRSFRAVVVSRAVLWFCIGSFVLLMAVVLTNFPRSRHPLTAVVMAVLFGGLLAIAPDAAVLAGQFGIIGLVLVIVMIAIRVLIAPSRSDRVFGSSGSTPGASHPSTLSLKKPVAVDAGPTTTQTIPSPSPTEASS